MRAWIVLFGSAAALAVGCGGSTPPAATPEPPAPAPEPPAMPAATEAGAPAPEMEGGAQSDAGSASSDAGSQNAQAEEDVKPKFTPGMSVDQAINAVPMGASRIDVDQETLGKPLTNMKVYKPCKLRSSQHFNVRVAVWDGKAVGVDVETKPKNARLAKCIDAQIRKLSWKDAVESLNTVNFAY